VGLLISSTCRRLCSYCICCRLVAVSLILPVVYNLRDILCAVLLDGWQFTRRIARRMAVGSSFFCLSTAFTVCALFCTANGSRFLLISFVNGFHHGLHSVLLRGWQRIAHSCSSEYLSLFAHRFAHRMAADCSFFHSSMAFPMVCTPFSLADDSALFVLPLVNGFHSLRAVLLNGWQRTTRSSARQQLSRFACHFP